MLVSRGCLSSSSPFRQFSPSRTNVRAAVMKSGLGIIAGFLFDRSGMIVRAHCAAFDADSYDCKSRSINWNRSQCAFFKIRCSEEKDERKLSWVHGHRLRSRSSPSLLPSRKSRGREKRQRAGYGEREGAGKAACLSVPKDKPTKARPERILEEKRGQSSEPFP